MSCPYKHIYKPKIDNQQQIQNYLIKRNISHIKSETLIEQYSNVNLLKSQLDQLNGERKKCLDQILGMKIKSKIQDIQTKLSQAQEIWSNTLLYLPAPLHGTVPDTDTVIKNWNCNPDHAHSLKSKLIVHSDLKHVHNDTPFGSKFVVLEGQLASLERSLIAFTMNKLNKLKFKELTIPTLIPESFLFKAGHLPKEEKNMYHIPRDNRYLSPTGEIGLLTWLTRKKNYKSDQYVTTVNNCYRREAGSLGSKTKGLRRVHEFKKCEMVVLTTPDKSYEILEKICLISQNILQDLGISYRVLLLSNKETGHHSTKTYDLEVFLNNIWTEVASISNCEDYQSKHLQLKINKEIGHTLNGTALAIPRILAYILENNQIESDIPNMSKIIVPEVLVSYMKTEYIYINQ